jgi:hypothetical protein
MAPTPACTLDDPPIGTLLSSKVIYLLGEYDFSEENDSFGIRLPRKLTR